MRNISLFGLSEPTAKIAVIAVLILIGSVVGADATPCTSYPWVFTMNTTAQASQVNDDFTCAARTGSPTIDSATFTGTTTFPGSTAVTSAGNLGLGTTTPGAPIEVFKSAGGYAAYITAGSTNTPRFAVRNQTSQGMMELDIGGGSTPVAVIQTGVSANIPLQLSASAYTFYNGNVEFISRVQVDSLASASATSLCINASVLSSCSSSIRYKENVRDASFGLRDIQAMRPVAFKWKGRDEHDFGFIAEEMAKINPLFVTYKDGRIEGVKYPQLSAVLAKAIQEQQQQISHAEIERVDLVAQVVSLKQEISTLRQVNDADQSEIRQLKAQISLASDNQAQIGRLLTQVTELQQRVGIRAASN